MVHQPAPKNGSPDASLAAAIDRLDQRLARLERVTERLVDLAPALERAAALAEQAPAMIATVGDVADGLAARMQAAGVDLDERARVLVRVAERLTAPAALEVVEALLEKVDAVRTVLDSGVLDPAPVGIVSKAGSALASAGSEDPPPIGMFGAMRALGNPDVARAMGFLMRFAQLFGRSLDRTHAALPAKSGE